MTGFPAALWTEILKARRSRMPWLTALGSLGAPLVGGLFMMILKDPALALRMGLITAKAQLRAGTADWPTFFGMLTQSVAIGGMILFGLVAIWVFGREWSDRTVKDLLALPTTRAAVVGAKLVVIVAWSAILAVVMYSVGLVVGMTVGLPGWSSGLALDSAVRLALIGFLTIMLALPFAWAASAGRGYLPPIGAMFLAIFLAQILAATGWGSYFPWSVAGLASGAAGPEAASMGAGSYILVVLTGIAGAAGTLVWWQIADHT